MNLCKEVKCTLVQVALADGATDPDSDSVDMEGFDGVMFLGIVGTIAATGTVTLAAEQSSDDSTFNALSGISAEAGAADDDKFLLLDVYRPTDRYVRTALTRGTADSVYGGTIAIQYKARKKPTVQDASTLAAQVLGISPDES